jgi:hypothetical protein
MTDVEQRRMGGSSAALCAEILGAVDRIYALQGPDEPDLGLNVTYVTTRRSLQRMATAQEWQPPASAAHEIHARLRSLESVEDPTRLGIELSSLPMWAFSLLDRRRPGRQVATGSMPRRRAGDPRSTQGNA